LATYPGDKNGKSDDCRLNPSRWSRPKLEGVFPHLGEGKAQIIHATLKLKSSFFFGNW
jgi:hypothetical protein